jgi:uncharacterized membrane protein
MKTPKDFSEEVKSYATSYHELTCHYNHTDQCGWYYGEQQRIHEYEAMAKRLEEIKKIISAENFAKLVEILKK